MISDVIVASWQTQQGGMRSSDPAQSVHISLILIPKLCFSLQHLSSLAVFYYLNILK